MPKQLAHRCCRFGAGASEGSGLERKYSHSWPRLGSSLSRPPSFLRRADLSTPSTGQSADLAIARSWPCKTASSLQACCASSSRFHLLVRSTPTVGELRRFLLHKKISKCSLSISPESSGGAPHASTYQIINAGRRKNHQLCGRRWREQQGAT